MQEIPVNPYPLCDCTKKALAGVKDRDYKPLANMFKVLADPARIKILESLGSQELCVCVLVDVTGLKYSALSYHLKNLKEAGLISSYKDGSFLIYELTDWGRLLQEFIDTSLDSSRV